MKITVKILSVLLIFCLTAGISLSASAYEIELAEVALCADVPDEVHTEISFSDGEIRDYAAAPDIEAIDDASYRDTIESYEVFYRDKALLDVTFTQYYTAEFTIPETTKNVILAGLTAENIEETQQRIIDSYSDTNDYFSLEDLSFIDAEKTINDHEDDNLCWAASCANILAYTGWAAQAGFETEDDVFDDFVGAFTDNGGIVRYGLGWFFNGVNTYDILWDDVSGVRDYGNSGNYLSDYAYDRVWSGINLYDDYRKISYSIEALRSGCGVALGVEIFRSNSHLGGHEVTMWGAVTDEAYEPDDIEYYDMIFVSDSDSDKYNRDYTDRRQARNELDLYRLSYFENEIYDEPCYTMSYFDGQNLCALYDMEFLIPYSDEIEKETDELATKNKTTTTDAAVTDVFLSDSAGGAYTEEFMLGDTVYITPFISNVGDYHYTVSPCHTLTATISGTDVSFKREFNSKLGPSSFINAFQFSAEGLKKGDYTLTVQFNADHQVQEAYYYNNTYTVDFSVVTDPTKYMAGDADDDWEITVLDATLIQKTLAMLIDDTDGKISVRGDLYGEGLNILSATAIQKHIALIDCGVSIGEIKNYETGE